MRNKEMLLSAKECVCYLERRVNNFDRKSWMIAVKDIFGGDAVVFSAFVVAQYARMNGKKYEDYSREKRGLLNPEGACSVFADMRNDSAFKRCLGIMDDEEISEKINGILEEKSLKVLSYDDLVSCAERGVMSSFNDADEMSVFVALIATRTHKTLQQSIVYGCFEVLKEAKVLGEDTETSMWMV